MMSWMGVELVGRSVGREGRSKTVEVSVEAKSQDGTPYARVARKRTCHLLA